jgi:rsbT antagonist protein RsbS
MAMDMEARIPVIRLWQRVVVPLQGDITDDTAARLAEDVLREIRDASAEGLVLDVTGVWTMDSHLCHVLANLAACARLMGTPTVICGMSATIAMTLQTMGADFRTAETAITLEEALERLGVTAQVRPVEEAFADKQADEAEQALADDELLKRPLAPGRG